jgi:hypothetical protein
LGGKAERKHIIICACSPARKCRCTPHLHTRACKRTHTLTARTHARTPHTHTHTHMHTHTHTHTYLLGTRTRTPAGVLHAGRVALCHWREDRGQFLPGHQPGPAGAQACPPPPALRVITHTSTHTHSERTHAHSRTRALFLSSTAVGTAGAGTCTTCSRRSTACPRSPRATSSAASAPKPSRPAPACPPTHLPPTSAPASSHFHLSKTGLATVQSSILTTAHAAGCGGALWAGDAVGVVGHHEHVPQPRQGRGVRGQWRGRVPRAVRLTRRVLRTRAAALIFRLSGLTAAVAAPCALLAYFPLPYPFPFLQSHSLMLSHTPPWYSPCIHATTLLSCFHLLLSTYSGRSRG